MEGLRDVSASLFFSPGEEGGFFMPERPGIVVPSKTAVRVRMAAKAEKKQDLRRMTEPKSANRKDLMKN